VSIEDGLTFGRELSKDEQTTDEKLSIMALDNQMRAERDNRDPYVMTADKLKEKLPGMGAASLQLPDGVAQAYDLAGYRLEDEQLLKEAQLSNITGLTAADVTGLIITRGDVDLTEQKAVYEKLGIDLLIIESPDIYTRYTSADRFVKTRAVIFQDDDVLVTEEQILALMELHTPGLLVANMFDSWIEAQGYFDLALVGLGAICDVGLSKATFERWNAKYGGTADGDHRLAWDADFIFGVLAPWRRFDLGGEASINMEIATADNRLAQTPGQHERKFESITMARRLRKVVLTMLTKNEQDNIERALASSADWWDMLLLSDSSTDDTRVVAAKFCEAHGKGFMVIGQPDGGFREKRQMLLEIARGLGDYQLLMDADEEWTEMIERPELWAEAYMIHYAGEVDYAQARLIASRFPWKWEGDKHAHLSWDWEGEVLAVNMTRPLIIHHGWERSAESHANDGVILEQMVAEGKDLYRDLFMLGKYYDGSGEPDKALDAYARRIALGSHDEEDYWCRLRQGVLTCEHLNDFKTGINLLWEAFQTRPHRAEALRAIAFYVTAVADSLPYPENDITLVLRHSYKSPTNDSRR
jgi:hypothetical protein